MWILIVVIAGLLVWLGLLTWKHRELRAQFIEVVTRVPIVGAKGPTADAVWKATAERVMKTPITITAEFPLGGHTRSASAERQGLRLDDEALTVALTAFLAAHDARERGDDSDDAQQKEDDTVYALVTAARAWLKVRGKA